MMAGLSVCNILWSSERTIRIEIKAMSRSISERAQCLARLARLIRTDLRERFCVLDAIACETTITILLDPCVSDTVKLDDIEQAVEAMCDAIGSEQSSNPKVIELPTVYGGVDGPDLDDVCDHTGLSQSEVVDRHTRAIYTVAYIGFAPGFPYLLGLDPVLATPRLGTPRTQVPAGSVGIAGLQTGCYPLSMPGGWRLIGRTCCQLFDPSERYKPALCNPGDRVRFIQVARHEQGLDAP